MTSTFSCRSSSMMTGLSRWTRSLGTVRASGRRVPQPSSGHRHGHDLGGLPSSGTPHPSGRLGRTGSLTKGSPPQSQGLVPVGSREGRAGVQTASKGSPPLPTLGRSLNPQLLEFTCWPLTTGGKRLLPRWLPWHMMCKRMSLGGRGKENPQTTQCNLSAHLSSQVRPLQPSTSPRCRGEPMDQPWGLAGSRLYTRTALGFTLFSQSEQSFSGGDKGLKLGAALRSCFDLE